jgi:Tfp pilus assembly protein PilX
MKISKRQNGFIVGTLLVIMLVVSVLIITVVSTTVSNFQSATKEQNRLNAQFAADSGLDVGIHELNQDENWTGTSGEVDLFTSTSGKSIRTTYEIEVTNGSTSARKIIRSIGRTYSPSTNTTPQTTRIFEVEAEAVTSGIGAASVVSGVGGLLLNNNAKITGGDVVVNGVVQINNNAQIGLSTNSVNVRVAHQVCPNPADATYPRVCNTGENGQPINIDTNGIVYANVQATNQTNGARMFNPGLISGSSFAPLPMPSFDRASLTSAVTTTISGNVTNCPGNARTFGTNTSSVTKIVGNLDPPNNCRITINGSLWVTGRISTGNNVQFIVPAAQLSVKPNVMVDGSGGIVLGNNFKVTTNASGTGIYFITFYSRASCSPNCATVSGADLANSINDQTIDLSNNASANGSILYARWTKVRVQNNGNLGAISGMTVELSNNAVINFTTSVPGSDNLVTTWVKRGYLRVFQ